MAAYDNAHSRLVAWLKILLPLAALVLLSTLFLVSRRIVPEMSLPYSDVDVAELAREQRLSAPRYSGMTSDGSTLSVTADSALPDPENPNRATATTLVARLDAPDGARTDLTAADGEIDTAKNEMTLHGNVDIRGSSGLHLTTDLLHTAMDDNRIEAPGPVQGDAPMGRISADSMVMTGENGSYVVVFKGSVKLIYEPQN